MLRSRGDRSGRFHRSPRTGPFVYRSRAGETIVTSRFFVRGEPARARPIARESNAVTPAVFMKLRRFLLGPVKGKRQKGSKRKGLSDGNVPPSLTGEGTPVAALPRPLCCV